MPAPSCSAPLICFTTGAPAAAGAAGVVAFAFAWLPALPMISYRLARLPIPSIPTGPDDLKTDTETVDGRRVLARSDRADEFLAALLGALAVLGVGRVTRARHRRRPARRPARRRARPADAGPGPLVPQPPPAAAAADRRARRHRPDPDRAVRRRGTRSPGSSPSRPCWPSSRPSRPRVGVSRTERRTSPVAGRALDILEVLLILAVIPLAAWASGLYGWVRSLNAGARCTGHDHRK